MPSIETRGVDPSPTRRWSTVLIGLVVLGALALAGYFLQAGNGLPGRFSALTLRLAKASSDTHPKRWQCHFDGNAAGKFENSCILGAPVAPKFVVYGDSHATELSYALGEMAKTKGESIRQLSASGCPPVLEFKRFDRPECAAYNAKIVEALIASPPSTIILAMSADFLPADTWPKLVTTMTTLRKAGHRVVMMGDAPSHPNKQGFPTVLARLSMIGRKPEDYRFTPRMDLARGVEAKTAEAAKTAGVEFVPVLPVLCGDTNCKAYVDGAVFYFDNQHPSLSGARYVVQNLLAPLLWPSAYSEAPQTD